MSDTQTLLDLNRETMRQAQRLVLTMADEVYTSTDERLYACSIGDHIRHVLEHYQRFLIGCKEGFIDYDARQHDHRISDDRNFAGSVIEQIVEGLKELPPEDGVVKVKSKVSSDLAESVPETRSTINRELQYLQLHTLHHFALMAIVLRTQGEDPPASLGFARTMLQSLHEH